MNIDEEKITRGIDEFTKFKSLAQEAIDRCKMAEEESQYYKGQKELLERQKIIDDERHQADVRRIMELETFITNILETFTKAEEKLRLAYRKPASTPLPSMEEFDEGVRKLASQSFNPAPDGIARVDSPGLSNQKRGKG